MADIFQEVDEDLKRDKYVELWKRYGKYAISAVAAVVLATAGMVAWREYREHQRMEDSRRYEAAIMLARDGKTQDAVEALRASAQESGAGYAALSGLQEGALLAREGDMAGAAAAYDRVAQNGSVDRILRDFATLLTVFYSLDTGEPAALEARLTALSESDNPWQASALELSGLLAMRAGDTAKARGLFTRLADDPLAPAGVRRRAGEMLSILGG